MKVKIKHILQDLVFCTFLLMIFAGAIYGAYTQKDMLVHYGEEYSSTIAETIPLLRAHDSRTNEEFYQEFKGAVVQVLSDTGTGSGFYVDGNYVVTNAHVVQGSTTVRIINKAGYQGAVVIHFNPGHDVAILFVGGSPRRPLLLGDSDNLEVGQRVRAIGSPYGFQNTYAVGMITGLNRVITLPPFYGLIQADVNIAPGASGSALLNDNGYVIGLNYAGTRGSASFGFAIPINMIKDEILQNINLHKNPITVSALQCQFEDGPGCVDLP